MQQAFDEFLSIAGMQARPLSEWLQPYLNWRWQERENFRQLKHVQCANELDFKKLISHNNAFIEDAERIRQRFSPTLFESMTIVLRLLLAGSPNNSIAAFLMEKEAPQILQIAKLAKRTESKLAHFFDRFVHDSLAGFDIRAVEMGGHWRYRRAFLGTEDGLIGKMNTEVSDRQVA